MNIGVYDIINDPFPTLHRFMNISAKENEFRDDKSIVKVLNRELKMDKLDSEHIYILALTDSFYPLGILLCSVGNERRSTYNNRTAGMGLLLLGAERFSVFHNHPHGVKEISDSDRELTKKIELMAGLFEIQFDGHIMITQDYYDYCNVMETNEALEQLKLLAKKNKEV